MPPKAKGSAMPDTSPGVGASASLNDYWTTGEGRAKWATNPKPWTTLYALLRKYMSEAKAQGLATEYFVRVFGHGPGARH
jgi:membrane-bound lytic murein transglycosylase MltF